jgi:signal transduction histidine kinase/ligand-binding sensor domain-containing protein
MHHILLLLFLLSTLFGGNLSAQEYILQKYNVRDGLLHSTVDCITQDSRGFIWIGTLRGVSRFDGNKFEQILDPDNHLDDRINDILEDRQGNIWFATGEHGLIQYNGETWKTWTPDDGLGNINVQSLEEDAQGRLWITTRFGGVSYISGDTCKTLTAEDGLVDNRVLSSLLDSSGNLWFGTSAGISRYDGHLFKSYLHNAQGGAGWVWAIVEDLQGRLWCGTRAGIRRWNGSDFTTEGVPKELIAPNLVIRGMMVDRQNKLWLLTSNAGLYVVDSESVERMDIEHGFPDMFYRTAMVDREENVWLGTTEYGILMYSGELISKYTVGTVGLPYQITAVANDSDGKLLYAYKSGMIYEWDGTNFSELLQIPDSEITITDLARDSQGRIWIGTQNDGLKVYDKGQLADFKIEGRGNRGNQILQILPDLRGALWVLTFTGLNRWDGESWQTFGPEDGVPAQFLTDICLDLSGNLWLGSLRQGVFRFDGKVFTNYREQQGLPDDQVNALEVDAKGNVWVGTLRGLAKFNGRRFRRVKIDGRGRQESCTFLVSGQQYLYIGTQQMLYRWDINSVNPIIQQTVTDFIPANSRILDAALDATGNLWLNGKDVLYRVQPNIFTQSVEPPPLAITSLRVNYDKVPFDNGAVLAYQENMLRVGYSALHFKNPDNVIFRYRLRGMNDTWEETNSRTVAYNELPPGQFTFELQARLRNGPWSETSIRMPITIIPPYWQRWWFRASIILALILAVWSGYRRRVRNVERRNEILETRIRERTQQLSAQSATLQSSKQALAEAQHIARLSSFEWNLESDEIRWSEEMYGLLDFDPAGGQLSNEQFAERIHPDDKVRVLETMAQTHQTGVSYDMEFRFLLKNGSQRWFHAMGSGTCNDGGTVVRICGTLQDVTEYKAAEQAQHDLEQQLRQAQKLESIGRLAGGIAHDFNNILTGIMGHAELIKMDCDSPDSEMGKASSMICTGVERAADLTQQLLGFARGGKYNPVPLNLNTVIQESVKVSEKIFDKQIMLQFSFERALHSVEVDKTQMTQVFTNLMINAKDAMPNGGTLQINTENCTLGEEIQKRYPEIKSGDYVMVKVSDTGIGIPREMQMQIFEPFFTTKGVGKGTGLGLAMAYGIIKNHHGYIHCESEPGTGATFTICLPTTENSVSSENSADYMMTGDASILIVDDEEAVRIAMQSQLEKLGYTVHLVESGSEAISYYSEKKAEIDLVLLDMIMPEMSGTETFAKLKGLNPDIKVLLISGYSQDEWATEILKNGADGFLQKPANRESLAKSICKILQ